MSLLVLLVRILSFVFIVDPVLPIIVFVPTFVHDVTIHACSGIDNYTAAINTPLLFFIASLRTD